MPKVDYITGVYLIKNTVNGKVYVGGAYKSLGKRIGVYHQTLPRGCCHNKHLQNAWNKYGNKSFKFYVLERCSPDRVAERETYWIKYHDACNPNKGYNICVEGGSRLGTPQSEESKRKNRLSHLGKTASQETKDKMSIVRTGRAMSLTHRTNTKANHWSKGPNATEIGNKISAGLQGHPVSEETRCKIRETKLKARNRAA